MPARAKKGRPLLKLAAVLLVLLVVFIFCLPMIAGAVVSRMLDVELADGSIVHADDVKVRWLGPVLLDGLTVTTPGGTKTLDLNVSVDTGVLPFLTDWMNLNEVVVSGEIVLPAPDPNAPPKPDDAQGGSGPINLPPSLRGRLRLDRLTLVVPSPKTGNDLSTRPADVVLDGTIDYAPGETIVVDLRAEGNRGPLGLGSAELKGELDGLVSDRGYVRTSELSGDGTLVTQHLATELLAPFMPPSIDIGALVGDRLDLRLAFDGTPQAGTLTLAVDAPNLTADGAVALADGVASVGERIEVRATRAAVEGGYAGLVPLLAESGVTLESAPALTLRAESLRLELPKEGEPFDLRTLAATITLDAEPARLTYAYEGGSDRPVRTQPATLRVVFDGPASAASIEGELRASVDGEPPTLAGVDLRFADLLDDAGGVRTDALMWPAGSMELTSVPSALVQPFLAGTPVRLAEDLGPSLELSLVRDDASSGEVRVRLAADYARLTARAVRTGEVITLRPDATLELDRPGPLVARAFADDAGLRIEPERVFVRVESLEVDTSKTDQPLREWLRAQVTADLGTIAVGSAGREPATLRDAAVRFTADDRRTQALLSAGGATANAEPALGTVDVQADLGELLSGGSTVGLAVNIEDLTPGFVRVWTDAEAAADALAAFGGTVNIEANPTITLGETFGVDGELSVVGPGGTLEADASHAGTGTRFELSMVVADGRTLAALLGTEDPAPLAGEVTLDARVELQGSLADASAVGGFTLSAVAPGVVLDAEGGAAKGRIGFTADVRTTRLEVLAGVLGTDEGTLREALGGEPTIHATFDTAQSADILGETGTGRVEVRGGPTSADATITLAADTLRVRTDATLQETALLDPFLGGMPAGTARAALGKTLRAIADVTLSRQGPTAFDTERFALDATIDAPLLRTRGPVVMERDASGFRLGQPIEATWTLTPELVALVVSEPEPAPRGAEPAAPALVLLAPTEVRLTASRLRLPSAAGARPDVAVDLRTGEIPLRLRGTLERTYTGLRVTAATAGESDAASLTASLAEGSREVLKAELSAVPPSEATGGRPAMSGSVTLTELDTTVLDELASGDGNISGFLGAWVSAGVELDRFPGTAGSVRFEATSPNADVNYAGKIEGDALVTTAPAKAVVRRITQDFGFRVARFIPVAGGIRKNPDTDQPAYVEAKTIVFPLERDVNKVVLDARIDIGTGSVSFDQEFIKLLDKRIVEQGRSLGDSFEAFDVTMKDGVFRTEELTIPIGEFEVPTTLVRDYPRDLETKRYKIPGGALAAEALRLAGTGAGAVKGLAMIEVKFSGPIDAENPEMDVKFTWDKDTILKDGVGEGIKDILRRIRD